MLPTVPQTNMVVNPASVLSSSAMDIGSLRSFREHVTPRRWYQLALFFYLNAHSTLVWLTYTPIAERTRSYYNISEFDVDVMAMIFLIAYIPFAFVATWLNDAKGLRVGLIVASVLNAVGSWIRYAGHERDGYYILLVGQTVAAIAQPFLIASPPKLAAQWFPVRERATATSLGTVSIMVGMALGFALPAPTTDPDGNATRLLFGQAIAGTIPCILTIFTFKEQPDLPPSKSSMRMRTGKSDSQGSMEKRPTLRHMVWKHALTNWNFIALTLGFGFGYGLVNTLCTILGQVLSGFDYSESASGWIGFTLIVCGIGGMVFFGLLADTTHRYVGLMRIGFLCCIVSMIGATLYLTLYEDKMTIYVYVFFGITGFFACGMMPVCFEAAVEFSYPLAECTSTGIVLFFGQISSIIQILVISITFFGKDSISKQDATNTLIFLLAGSVLSLTVCFCRSDYRRYKMDVMKKDEESEAMLSDEEEVAVPYEG